MAKEIIKDEVLGEVLNIENIDPFATDSESSEIEEQKEKKQRKSIEKKKRIGTWMIIVALFFALFMGLLVSQSADALKSHMGTLSDIEQQISDKNLELKQLEIKIARSKQEIEELTSITDRMKSEYGDLLDMPAIELYVPEGYGAIHTFMAYNQNWVNPSPQYTYHNQVKDFVWYDNRGFARLKDRYFVAVKPYYGEVGDYLNVYQDDGTIIRCVIGDIKGMENPSIYYHINGDVVEFMVDKNFTSVSERAPEFSHNITKIVNVGKYLREYSTN